MTEVFIVLAGCFTWTFIEYGMHHWNGHLMKGKTLFSKEHLAHHSKKDYFSTARQKIAYSGLIAIGVWLVGIAIFGMYTGSFYAGGIYLGYVLYELIHWSNHVHPPRTAYGRWARRHHFSHHFTDARYNHGVTSPLWDIVFRTYRRPGLITVPNRLQMEWLVDPQTGCVRHQFSDDFKLRRPQRRPNLGGTHFVDSNLNLNVGAHVVVESA